MADQANVVEETTTVVAPVETGIWLLDIYNRYISPEMQSQILSTLFLLVAVYLLRNIVIKRLSLIDFRNPESRRRMAVMVLNISRAIIIIGLVIIWATQLRTMVAGITFMVAAVVVATKEIILCLTGTIFRAVAKPFKIGDRIEVSGQRGDVIDQTLLNTTIMEVGPGALTQQNTGRILTIPNGTFLSAVVINETQMQDFVLHIFSIHLKVDEDWERAEKVLLEAANAEATEYISGARKQFEEMQKEHALDVPSVEPRVIVKYPEAGKIQLVLRIPTPARKKGRIEQQIIRRFLKEFYPPKKPEPKVAA